MKEFPTKNDNIVCHTSNAFFRFFFYKPVTRTLQRLCNQRQVASDVRVGLLFRDAKCLQRERVAFFFCFF